MTNELKRGRGRPKTGRAPRIVVYIAVNAETHAQLHKIAERDNRTISGVARIALIEYINKHTSDNKIFTLGAESS